MLYTEMVLLELMRATGLLRYGQTTEVVLQLQNSSQKWCHVAPYFRFTHEP